MRALTLIAAAAAVASCTQATRPDSFTRDMAGRVAGPPQSCVSVNPVENLHVIDSQTVAYGYGSTIYINHLPGPCPGLSQFNTVIVQAGIGSQYCRGDHVRGLETGAIIPGPSCNLGDWVPYRRP